MLKTIFAFCSCIYLTFLSATFLIAQETTTNEQDTDIGYISDFLIINIRDQIESPFSVVGRVRSNDPVTILEERGKYLFIETSEKKRGWISSQYVTRKTPKPIIIANLRKQIETLQSGDSTECQEPTQGTDTIPAGNDQCELLQTKVTEAQNQIEALETHLSTCSQELSNATKSEPAIACGPEITKLKQELEEARQRYLVLSQEHKKRGIRIATLENILAKQGDKTRFYWFGAGALVFILGLLFGSIRNRKRDRYIY